MKASNSAGGLDGWDPIDFKLFSLHCFSVLVDMLNAIEHGAPWPDGIKEGRLAFLAKDPNETEDPLSYRPLLVLPPCTGGGQPIDSNVYQNGSVCGPPMPCLLAYRTEGQRMPGGLAVSP